MCGRSDNAAAECPLLVLSKEIYNRIVEHHGAANMQEPLLEIGAIKVVGPDK